MPSEFNLYEIINSYAAGYFLMADPDTSKLGWYRSIKRTLIPLDNQFHCPRSLRRLLNKNVFNFTVNQAFSEVVEGCRARQETWISEELVKIYKLLHREGWAYSFESWLGGELAGGVLGIAIRGVFIGESMFFYKSNGSKVALVKLVEHLRKQNFLIFDAQLNNQHLSRFGAYEISDSEYSKMLEAALESSAAFSSPI
jgi:leucyl/phenylalanyl-tRNA---protein transferase